MKKYLPVILAIVVGLGAGIGTSLADVLKPYSALIGAISALVVAIVGLIKKEEE